MDKNVNVKVDIFSGFLGAGKTQLIKKLIDEGYYNERIAIIENEFGEVSIDGEILRRTNTLVKEINAGCICCQVTGDFKESIKDIVENCNVDRLLVEPTGIAKLSDIKKAFLDDDLKEITNVDRLITVVDCEKFNLYLNNFKHFFLNQVKNANYIILSRSQNLKVAEVEKVVEEIKVLNKSAVIVSNHWNKVSAFDLIPQIKLEKNNSKKHETNFKKVVGNNKSLRKKESEEEKSFETFAIKIERNVSKEELVSKFNFIKNSIEFGEIIRAKGIVNTRNGKEQFDYTLSEINMEKIMYRGETVISFIGTNLDKDKIKKFFL